VQGLRNVDYAEQVFLGKSTKITLRDRGYVYGPIRLTFSEDWQVYKTVIEPILREAFIRDKKVVIVVRDPRDYLVSSYYSFGFTHSLSPVGEIRVSQQQNREQIQDMTIDDYALSRCGEIADAFARVNFLRKICPRCVVLRYEDMVDHWEIFSEGLTKFFELKPKVLDELYRRSRPKAVEDLTSHRRSGKTGDFKRKFQPQTITELNARFQDILQEYGYEMDETVARMQPATSVV
jgi:hypothetical protein